MQLRYNLTRRDFMRFYVGHRVHQVSLWILTLVFSVLIGALFFTAEIRGPRGASMPVGILVVAVGIGLAYFVVMFLSIALVTLVQIAIAPSRKFGAYEVENGPEGVTERAPDGTTTTTWGAIHKVRRFSGMLLIYLTSSGAFIVPERAAASASEWQQLCDGAETWYRSAHA